uniref:DUF7597 domain-containing protein n=1 Tax=Arundo donax TaxID=35708 RepID=A0A0A9B1C7_ARUDO
MFLQQVMQYIQNEQHLHVRFSCKHPHGIGLIQLGDQLQRDRLFRGSPHNIDGFRVRFIRHDKARNFRDAPYHRNGWILFLGFPLDYMTLEHVDEACASFGKMIYWHDYPENKGFVLVKCLYDDAESVPRSLVFR